MKILVELSEKEIECLAMVAASAEGGYAGDTAWIAVWKIKRAYHDQHQVKPIYYSMGSPE